MAPLSKPDPRVPRSNEYRIRKQGGAILFETTAPQGGAILHALSHLAGSQCLDTICFSLPLKRLTLVMSQSIMAGKDTKAICRIIDPANVV